jgi:hypothetical protein
VFMLCLLQMLQIPMHRQPVPCSAPENLALMAHPLKLLHLDDLDSKNLRLQVLRRGNLRK